MFRYLRYLPALYLKHRPLHLSVFVTNRCNARCGFCFYETNHPVQEMTLEEYRAMARGIKGPLLWLAFSGGEVFLREDISEIARAFYAKARPAFILLSTNGLLPERTATLTAHIASRCKASTVVLKVSLDGVGPEHDRIRGVPGAFDRAMRTISLLGSLRRKLPNLQLGVNTVVFSGNLDSIEKTIGFVNSLSEVQVHTVSLVRGRASAQMGISPEMYSAVMAMLRKRSRKRLYGFSGAALKAAQDRLQQRFIEMVLRGLRLPLNCTAGRLSLVVTETGEVFPCEAFHLSLGNLRPWDYDLKALLKHSLTKETIERISRCQCSHECNLMLNILGSARAYPMLLREYLKLRTETNEESQKGPLCVTGPQGQPAAPADS